MSNTPELQINIPELMSNDIEIDTLRKRLTNAAVEKMKYMYFSVIKDTCDACLINEPN